MQFTVRGVPERLAQVLRKKAQEGHQSLNSVLLEALAVGAGLGPEPVKHRDLTDLAGLWVEDPEIEAVLAEQDVIDPEMWS